jgi:hypothetical protein
VPLQKCQQLGGAFAERHVLHGPLRHLGDLLFAEQGNLSPPGFPKRDRPGVKQFVDLVGQPRAIRAELLDEEDCHVRVDQGPVEVDEHPQAG